MTFIDARGRVFGRINLVDAVAVFFLFGLIPAAYGTWLLFRPSKPRITTVTRVEVSKDEQRIASGAVVSAKLKVHGTGFTPMLRASIGSAPSIGFIYEDPNSADVIVGAIVPGEYDLVLYDGVQEVARAPKAVAIQISRGYFIRAAGRLIDLDRATADALTVGAAFPSAEDARVQVAALGPVRPGQYLLFVNPSTALDLPRDQRFERAAALTLRCDATAGGDDQCLVGGRQPTTDRVLPVPGAVVPLSFVVGEVMPARSARPLDLVVRFPGGPELALVKAGDRDVLFDDRAAVVTGVESRQAGLGGVEVRLRIGADEAHDGWRYRGRVVSPGASIALTTERYAVTGIVVSVAAQERAEPGRR